MKKHLLVALSVLCLCSCFEEKKVDEKPKEDIVAKQETKPAPEKNDKYVYIDAYNCLHTKKDCLWHINQENWERPTHAIQFVLKYELGPNDVGHYCRKCVDVERFEEIKEVLRINGNRRKIYDRCKRRYDMGTFDDFESDINNPIKRKKLYDALKEDGYTGIGDTFEEFEELITFRLLLQE